MKILSDAFKYSTWLWEPKDFDAKFVDVNHISRIFLEFNSDNKEATYRNILQTPDVVFEALVSDNRWLTDDKKFTPKFVFDNYNKYKFSALHLDLEFWVGADKKLNKVRAKKLIQLILEFKNRLKCKINIDLPIWFYNEYREEYEVLQPMVDEITYMAYFTNPAPIKNCLDVIKKVQKVPFVLSYELAALPDSPSSSFHGKDINDMLMMHRTIYESEQGYFNKLMNICPAIHHFKTLVNWKKK